MTATPTAQIRHGLVAAAVLAGAVLAGCDQANTDTHAGNGGTAVSAGTQLDDSVITTKIKTALVTDAEAKGADTSVQTRKGQVILSGFVDSQAQADREVQLAKGVEGVSSVDDKLIVKDGKSSAGNVLDDSIVTTKIKTALMTDAGTKGNEIAVTTNKGVVQLSGFVDSADQQARATTVARNVEGVQSVVNDTKLKQ